MIDGVAAAHVAVAMENISVGRHCTDGSHDQGDAGDVSSGLGWWFSGGMQHGTAAVPFRFLVFAAAELGIAAHFRAPPLSDGVHVAGFASQAHDAEPERHQ